MGGMGLRKRFALDTNLIFDLAEEKNFAFTFIEVFQEKGYELLLPPTAAQELAFAFARKPEQREIAAKGLSSLLRWGIKEFDLVSVGHGITEEFSLLLRAKDLIPPSEANDGYILAETALADIPVLVTSDKHLLNIPEEALTSVFESRDLFRVSICHPRNLLKAVNMKA
jgi:predicted nucleic acid-binding protein